MTDKRDEERKRDDILRRLLKTPPEPRHKSERDKNPCVPETGETEHNKQTTTERRKGEDGQKKE